MMSVYAGVNQYVYLDLYVCLSLCVYLCMCVSVCVSLMYVSLRLCVYVCVLGAALGVMPQSPFTFFLRQDLLVPGTFCIA